MDALLTIFYPKKKMLFSIVYASHLILTFMILSSKKKKLTIPPRCVKTAFSNLIIKAIQVEKMLDFFFVYIYQYVVTIWTPDWHMG